MLRMHGFATPRDVDVDILMKFLSKKMEQSNEWEVELTWRQQSLDLEKRGPVRPRASVALRKK